MRKLISTVLIPTILLLSQPISKTAIARTCAGKSCPPQPVQFVPGQRINIEIVNLTSNLVQMQKIDDTDAIAISPGQKLNFFRGGSTEPNLSLVFWDVNGLALQARVRRQEARTLTIELRPGGRIPPGDRTVYLKNDGRVSVF